MVILLFNNRHIAPCIEIVVLMPFSRGHYEELRCVLAVIRHGDRTPKQKMKMKVTQEPLLELLRKHLDAKGKQAKLKSPSELQELLDVTRALLADMDRR